MWEELDSDDELFKKKQGMTDQEIDETCEYLKKHPLTINANKAENLENNPMLDAISQLKYDDTPENNAKTLNVLEIISGTRQCFNEKIGLKNG
jgi:hypothetical protein